jgi:hypothetical protein
MQKRYCSAGGFDELPVTSSILNAYARTYT